MKMPATDNNDKDKDIEFIDKMIPHHQMAIDMVNEYYSEVDNADLKTIMENIKTSQADEIEKMKEIKKGEKSKSVNLDSSIQKSLTGKSLYDFLVANKSALIAEKKYSVKHSDAFKFSNYFVKASGDIIKANKPIDQPIDSIKVEAVINTTNWLDSHKDVHLPGIWKKSLSENKSLYLLQEHSMTFKGIITDEVQAFTKSIPWTELGVKAKGETEALVFIANIQKSRNDFMFNEYKQGRVKNHSVGMLYVNIELAINDADYKEEFAVWNKYIDQIVNKQDAEADGIFWAVKQAKVIEGSAVPIGSNIITPVLNNNLKSQSETKHDTGYQPSNDTDSQPSLNDDVSKSTSQIICPNCLESFSATTSDKMKCPECGQFVSQQGGITVPFDMCKAIRETKFIKL